MALYFHRRSSNPNNLPPLREIIWRRLRRRNAQLNLLEEQAAEELSAAAVVRRKTSKSPIWFSIVIDALLLG